MMLDVVDEMGRFDWSEFFYWQNADVEEIPTWELDTPAVWEK